MTSEETPSSAPAYEEGSADEAEETPEASSEHNPIIQ